MAPRDFGNHDRHRSLESRIDSVERWQDRTDGQELPGRVKELEAAVDSVKGKILWVAGWCAGAACIGGVVGGVVVSLFANWK